ncbi:MAG: hypothetical protein LLG13_18635 [Bacteroidales bacterium]|nr:hypothetical protein [Bacteroidales bacterium]
MRIPVISDTNQLSFEIASQVLKNRKLDESLNKLKNNLGEILTNIRFRNEIQDAEFILSFGKPEKDPWQQLKSSVGFIESFAAKHKKKICFAFDEFGDIEKLDGVEIIKLFRGLIQHQKQTVYIFTGSYESVMNKLFVAGKSPFYRMVKIIQPGFIESQYLINLLKKNSVNWKFSGNPSISEGVLNLPEGIHIISGFSFRNILSSIFRIINRLILKQFLKT